MAMSNNPVLLQKVVKDYFKLPERQEFFPGLPFQLQYWCKGSVNLYKFSGEVNLGISLPYLRQTYKNAGPMRPRVPEIS